MTPKDPMARDFRELCKDSTHEWTTHPSLEQLALYLRQELETDQQEQIRDHVTFCKTCQKELLGLQSFRELVDESTRLADLGRCPPWCTGRKRSLQQDGDGTRLGRRVAQSG